MDNLQAYVFLFNDSLLTSLIVIPRLPYAADVMLTLQTYNPYLIFIISLIGNIIGCVINWVLGMGFRKLEKLESLAERISTLKNAEIFFNKKGKWILLLSAVPFWGALFTTAAGVLHFRMSHFLILIIFSNFIGQALKIFF